MIVRRAHRQRALCLRVDYAGASDQSLQHACRYNMTTVPSRSSWSTITDKHAKPASAAGCFPGVNNSIPPLIDIPPHIVSERLHSNTIATPT